MADNNYSIPVDVKFTTAGEAEAGAGFKKLAESAEDAGDSAKQIEDLTDGVADLKKELGPVAAEAKEAGDALEDAGKKSGSIAGDLAKIKQVQIGQVFGEAAGKIAGFAAKISEAGPELEATFGAENAARIRGFSRDLEAVAGGASSVATAFATGGPIAAAVTAVALLGVEFIKSSAAASQALDDESAAGQRAADMKRELLKMQQMGADAYWAEKEAVDALTQSFDAETEAIKNVAAEKARANRIVDAEDDLAAKKRKRADSEKIKNGAAPEDVAAATVQDEASRSKAKIDRDLEVKQTAIQSEYEKNTKDRGELERLKQTPGYDAKKLEEFENRLKAAEEKNAKDRLDYSAEASVATLKKIGIDEDASGKVDSLASDKAKREAAEKRTAAAQKQKADAEAARDRREAQRESLDGKEKTLDDTSRARGLTMRNAGLKRGNETAANVGKALSDGTDAAEIQKLGDQVKEAAGKNGAAMTAALEKVLAELNSQASEIEKLKGQIRKGRDLK